ncbi:tectonic-like isoform X1 [Bradysia coprophila]|uniref:tectonic-like isoform X1 n=1 Tax=Bradysia coprophila TaxID=38358 RepID=UPI00187DD63E|nr:tectonic-like isoform X1 [Bradysia coprophila]
MHLQLLLVAVTATLLLSTAEAFVKIDVSKLSSTSTAGQTDSTTPSTSIIPQQNVTIPSTVAITTPIPPTVGTVATNRNASENSTSNTELNQTSPVNDSRPSLDEHVPHTSRVKISPDNYYCPCDLMVNFCDINCCCDNDCIDDMLSVFVCDEKEWSIYDFEYDTGLTSCEIRNDLFCVVGKKYVLPTTRYDINLLGKRTKYKWPMMFASYGSDDDNRESYKSGDSVLAFDDKTEGIGTFVVPYSITGDYCHLNVPIKYLHDQESKCLRSYEQSRVFLDELQSKLKSTKILGLRKANEAMMLEHCTGADNHCLEIQMVDCFQAVSRNNCMRFNSTEIDETIWLNKEIIIQFRHNFTNILNCTAFLVYIRNDIAMPSTLVHSVKIQFLQANESMANIHRISGNIGYMQGKPVITAKMIPLNETNDDSPKILDYFHPNKTFSNDEHFMKIPAIRQNVCVLTNHTYDIIRFGENLFLTCDVALDENVTTESNFTIICSTLQQKIFSFILNEYTGSNDTNGVGVSSKVSEFGNPKNDSNYWINANLRHGIVDAVEGKYEPDDSGNEFTCKNMILSINFEFLYASLRVGTFDRQNLIKNVDFVFGTRVDLKFNLNETVKVPIFLDVMFIDLTNAASFVSGFTWIVLVLVGLVCVFLINKN